MAATGKQSVAVCVAAAVLVCSLAPTAIAARYGYIPERLLERTSSNHDRMRARLNARVIGERTVLDIATQLLKVLPVNLSETCANQSAYFLGHLDNIWALQMIDASGKPESGFLEGNIVWFGDFDECVGISTGEQDTVSFSGQYCLIQYPFQLGQQAITVNIGSCVPSGCSSDDTAALFNTVLKLLNIQNSTGVTAACHLSDRPYDTGAYVAIVICSIFAVMLVLGTTYDLVKIIRLTKPILSNYQSIERYDGKVNEAAGVNEKSTLIDASPKRCAQSQEQIGKLEKLLLSFSLYSNGKKLLSTSQQGDSTLSCLHGIRFLSMCWVILGHIYVFALTIESDPANFSIITRRSFQVINNATVSVDSFFVLSGLLVTYLLLQQLDKFHGNLKAKEWGLVYLHRYIRLTPVYMILLLIWAWLANYFSDGPLWPTSGSLDPFCEKYWWTNLLYINNFVPTKDVGVGGCMGWAWYLANDMQFFILTPPLAYLLYRKWYIGVGILSLMIVASVSAAAGVVMSDSLGWSGASQADYFADYYVKPWCRFMTYGVGVLLGYLIYSRKDKQPLPLFVVVLGWLVAAASCLAVLYGPYDAQFGSRVATATLGESAANSSMSRLAWSIGLSWLIFACSTNSGGPINTLLSWKPFIPLGRLTYCAYLIHPIVMTVAASASKQTIHFDDITMTLRFLGILVLTLALAFVASLSFEAPVIGVERILIRPETKK